MRSSARLQTTIELVDKINISTNQSADKIISNHFRKNRYIGAKDRRQISLTLFSIIRNQAKLTWVAGSQSARLLAIAHHTIIENLSKDEILSLFDGSEYGPNSLAENEMVFLDKIFKKPPKIEEMPNWCQIEMPEWIMSDLTKKWGSTLFEETLALNTPAPMDLRVNLLKTDRLLVRDKLEKEGINPKLTQYSSVGLRIEHRVNILGSDLFKNGLVEIQDEGSQLVSLLVDPRPNMLVIDLCAGSGGKTLAMAPIMQNTGKIFACDVNEKRLSGLLPRLKRAHVTNVSKVLLTGLDDSFYSDLDSSADRVVVDVPCSGSGVWRRNPDEKWKLSTEQLSNYVKEQSKLLQTGAKLVSLSGRLIYITCSILPIENEDQINTFLSKNKSFRLINIKKIWQNLIGKISPTIENNFLNLTPFSSHTDGFFCAIMERVD